MDERPNGHFKLFDEQTKIEGFYPKKNFSALFLLFLFDNRMVMINWVGLVGIEFLELIIYSRKK